MNIVLIYCCNANVVMPNFLPNISKKKLYYHEYKYINDIY